MEIDLHKEFQDVNIKLATLTQAQTDLCKKVSSFIENGAPRCADQDARIEALAAFKESFEKGEHAICAAGKGRWEDTRDAIKGLRDRQWWILGVVFVQAVAVIYKFITG